VAFASRVMQWSAFTAEKKAKESTQNKKTMNDENK
jgi:hypothetical protein